MFRKTGVKVRLYAAHAAAYPQALSALPDAMKQDILKASVCKKLTGLSCSPYCAGGYTFLLDETECVKCRNLAFLQSLTPQTAPHLRKLIALEAALCET